MEHWKEDVEWSSKYLKPWYTEHPKVAILTLTLLTKSLTPKTLNPKPYKTLHALEALIKPYDIQKP